MPQNILEISYEYFTAPYDNMVSRHKIKFISKIPRPSRSRAVYLSDGRCNSSSAEAGVLTAITGHEPNPPEGGTHCHRQRASPSHYYTHQGSETPLIFPAAPHPLTRGVPQ
ncbi:hypothetical protein AVEN_193152-1 [Araneus ventricosus]|uniref:Uncharacterized protein n=1 Tax=Araneus ventricosus TaxID=182803 RepID=A0A4Y2B2K5_ARAVE|nr:hypothetical protein AVEN_193152-1 [Araneus ventricosus]